MDLTSDSFVDQKGVVWMLVYLLLLLLFLGYSLLTFWPGPSPLVVSYFQPTSVPGGRVKIYGSGFVKGVHVAFDDATAKVEDTESTSVTLTLPEHAAGKSSVVVRNPSGQTVVIPNGFSFEEPPKPSEAPNAPQNNKTPGGNKATQVTKTSGAAAGSEAGDRPTGANTEADPKPAVNKATELSEPNPTQPSPGENNLTKAAAEPKEYHSPEGSYSKDITYFWRDLGQVNEGLRILLVISVVGALGSLIHVFRSFYWYAGNRSLKWSWLLMYILLPFNGAGLAVLFYLIIRGGISASAPTNPTSLDGYAAVAALVGMFTQPAMAKLKQIAEAFFAAPEPGKDPAITPLHITGITPPSGPADGGTQVTITGTGFAQGNIVIFGGIPAAATSVSVSSSTRLTATTPKHAPGAVDVEVSNSLGQKSSLARSFTFEAPATVPPGGPAGTAPTVSAIAPPAKGPTTGGTQVTLTGTGFTSGITVSFGGGAATSVNVTSSTELTATTPAHATGVVDVEISNSAGQKSSLPKSFTFTAAASAPGGGQAANAPNPPAIVPVTGSTVGGDDVTIIGTGFADGDQVTFGGIAATSVSVTSDTQLTAKPPPHDAGAVDVEVSNSAGSKLTLNNSFTYQML